MTTHSSVSLVCSSCIKIQIHKPRRNPTHLAVPEEQPSFGKKNLRTSHAIPASIWNLPSRAAIKATQLFSVNPNQRQLAVPPPSFEWDITDRPRKAYPAFPLFLNISSFLHKPLLTIFVLCTVNGHILPPQFATALSLLLHPLPFF